MWHCPEKCSNIDYLLMNSIINLSKLLTVPLDWYLNMTHSNQINPFVKDVLNFLSYFSRAWKGLVKYIWKLCIATDQ
jgi:hypothetical protein